MCLAGDSIQPEYIAEVRDPDTGDWGQSRVPLSKDYENAPTTGLPGLKKNEGFERNKFTIAPENFSHVSFEDALNHINADFRVLNAPTRGSDGRPTSESFNQVRNAGDLTNVQSGGVELAGKWGAVRDEIARVTRYFNSALDSLMKDTEHWDGETKRQAFENVRRSFQEPDQVSAAAGGMETLVDAFTRTIDYVYKNIEGNRPNYEYNINLTNDEDRDEYLNQFNNHARKVLGEVFRPNVEDIAGNNPKFTTGELPNLGEHPAPVPHKQLLGDGTGVPFMGGGKPVSTPDFGSPKLPTGPSLPTLPTGPDDPPTGTDDLPGLPDDLGDPTRAASDATPSGLGSPPPTGGPMSSPKGGPPEGALGLGPRGLGGPLKTGGGAGGGAKGGGAGRLPPTGRPASVPTVAAGRAGPGVAVPGAGLSNMAGAPGMGAPAAGHGGGQNGKDHQVMKALRRKKSGEQVMGKADAVVPVVGEPEKPDAQRNAEADQPDRIT